MIKVIFVCTGNICRSPIAAGILKSNLNDMGYNGIKITSMGTHGLKEHAASQFGIEICAENGVDISDHISRQLVVSELEEADLILCLEKIHKEYIRVFFPAFADKTFLLGAWPDLPEKKRANIADPYMGSKRAYKKAFKRISDEINRVIPFIEEYYLS